jgi:hypothetical protein
MSHLSNIKCQTSLQLVQGEPVFLQLGHEAHEGREASHVLLNILDIPDLAYFGDG